MSLTLSTQDLDRIEACQRTLLAPLAYPSLEAWASAALTDAKRLLGVHRSMFRVVLDGRVICHSPDADRQQIESAETTNDESVPISRSLGVHVYSMRQLVGMIPGGWAYYHTTDAYNDYYRPQGIEDGLGFNSPGFERDSMPPLLGFYGETFGSQAFGPRGVELLRLIGPAFAAGMQAYTHLRQHRRWLDRLLDQTAAALAIANEAGKVVHQSAALVRLRSDLGPNAAVLDANIRNLLAAAQSLATPGAAIKSGSVAGPLVREFSANGTRLRATATELGSPLGESKTLFAVLVECLNHAMPEVGVVIRRFGLTRREAEVALLLARGKANAEVAAALGISPFTARRHTERVLQKAGAATRAEVASKVLGIYSEA